MGVKNSSNVKYEAIAHIGLRRYNPEGTLVLCVRVPYKDSDTPTEAFIGISTDEHVDSEAQVPDSLTNQEWDTKIILPAGQRDRWLGLSEEVHQKHVLPFVSKSAKTSRWAVKISLYDGDSTNFDVIPFDTDADENPKKFETPVLHRLIGNVGYALIKHNRMTDRTWRLTGLRPLVLRTLGENYQEKETNGDASSSKDVEKDSEDQEEDDADDSDDAKGKSEDDESDDVSEGESSHSAGEKCAQEPPAKMARMACGNEA